MCLPRLGPKAHSLRCVGTLLWWWGPCGCHREDSEKKNIDAMDHEEEAEGVCGTDRSPEDQADNPVGFMSIIPWH